MNKGPAYNYFLPGLIFFIFVSGMGWFRHYIFFFLSVCIPALSSCTKSPDAGQFAPPQLGTVQVQAQDCFSVVMQGSMQQPEGEMLGGLVYGFYYGTDEDNLARVVAKGGQSSFSAAVDGLSIGANYICKPFVKNGVMEVTGPAIEFRTLDPFDDAVFRSYVMENFDSDGNGGISRGEAEKVREIRIDSSGVGSLKGVEVFTYITFLSCCNNSIKELDLSRNIYLDGLHAERNLIEALDLRANKDLKTIICWENRLKSINVEGLESLEVFFCWMNNLTELDITTNVSLEHFGCAQNEITELDLSNNERMLSLAPNHTLISTLDLSHCPELFSLEIQGADNMVEVDVSCCPQLRLLHAYECTNLKTIYIHQGQEIEDLRKENHTALVEKQR